ncbi:MAG: thioesterase family protein [Pseudomonadota bacterium]
MTVIRASVQEDWIDFNGHMRDAYYMLVISWANDAIMDELGLDDAYRRSNRRSMYNIDTRIRYLKEAKLDEPLIARMRMLDADDKRWHLHTILSNEETGAELAVNESILCHVAQDGPQAIAFPEAIARSVAGRLKADAGPLPALRCEGVQLRR